ncbi:MAG: hypothetical protein IPJ74_26165 [Saprospiraceae bacterium]|nr:hypothetical protein [Saprospiraceae bacterium]
MQLNQDFKEFIELLNFHKVRYLVVGGYAVGFYGYPRYTGDIDIWIAISADNAAKVLAVLHDFDFGSLPIQTQDLLQEDLVLQLGQEPIRIDLLTSVTGIHFEECYPHATIAQLNGLEIYFVDLAHLKENKRATGRQKDLGDLENLP